jgi:hypothetical protein
MSTDARYTYSKERKGRREFKGFFALPANPIRDLLGLAISAVSFEGGRQTRYSLNKGNGLGDRITACNRRKN